jgi:hypothetical protein
MTTSAELQIVQQIKEECCYVAFDPVKEEVRDGLRAAKAGAGAW